MIAMSTFVYLDHNYVIQLLTRAKRGDTHLAARLREGIDCKIVLSTIHWYEAARSPDDRTAYETAEFFDSLSPIWVRDRIGLQRREIKAFLD
ncbi:MAG: hypothetical protein WAR24_09130, partial [Candidatus Acidiferrales bacterium]